MVDRVRQGIGIGSDSRNFGIMTERRSSNGGETGLLRILATTDLHSNLLSHDYYADRPDPGVGLSRVATLIGRARQEAAAAGGATVLLDNGDALQGAPICEGFVNLHREFLQSDSKQSSGKQSNTCQPTSCPPHSRGDGTQIHPLMTAFSVLKYDAIGLGNHDFNFGLSALEHVLQSAPCPVVCSNMHPVVPERNLPFLQHAILERRLSNLPEAPVLRIGILSVLPPQTMVWDAHLLQGRVQVQDMVQAAAAQVAALRAAGCDLIVALAHTGLGGEEVVPEMENALCPIVATAGIDAVIGGHTHLILPNPDHPFGKPVVMPGAHGSHLGQIDLHLRHGADGWKVDTWQASAKPISRRDAWGRLTPVVSEDAQVVQALTAAHEDTQARMKEPVGHSCTPLHSYFTFFGEDRGLALVAAAQMAALRPMLTGTNAGSLPLLSAVSPGKFGGRSGPENYTDIAAGDLCMRNVADLQIFPNELWLVIVSGAELLDWLEMSAGLFNQISPASQGRELVNQDRAGHNFDVLFGLEYEIDLAEPARFSSSGLLINPQARRVKWARYKGHDVIKDQHFAVATSSYRVSGGGNFKMVQNAERLQLPSLKIRDAIRDYVAERLPKDPLSEAAYPWHLTALDGAGVCVFIGPAARSYLDELPEGLAEDLGVTASGFLKLGLKL